MKYCSVCLNVDTRPNIKFKNDLCPACIYWQTLKDVDWELRINELMENIKKLPKYPRRKFDCLIGVSGGKDSTRQALWVRDKLKLKPLLVSIAYPPEQITNRGTYNISNLIELGFDVHYLSYSPQTWRKLARYSFFKYLNPMKFSENAILSVSPLLAIKYKIPIIFLGENPAHQLGDLKTMGKTGFDANRLRYANTFSNGKIDWLEKGGFKREKIFQLEYPSQKEVKKYKIQSIYLGWFWKDWSIVNNGAFSALEGLKIRSDMPKNTADLYRVFSLDEDWVMINQTIKYYKYGFGRASDYVNEEIRIGRITRDEGIALAQKYDSACGEKYIKNFCNYLGITKDQFWKQIYKKVNKKLFKITPSKKIIPKFKVGFGLLP
jgi:N-acetyl sugar amidotransferase